MEQNTFNNQSSPFNSQEDRSKVPPPPPSYDQQVGVRTMSSDLESIKQSGGESPQSQVFSANEVFRSSPQDTQFIPPSSPTPSAPVFPEQFVPPSSATAQPHIDEQVLYQESAKKPFSFKALLIIVGIIIVAAAVGYGVYYLVSLLRSAPNIIPPTPPLSTSSSPALFSPSPSVEVENATHTSLLVSPASAENISLTAVSLADFKTALSAREKLLVGTVKDISFSNESGKLITAEEFINAFFPSSAPQLAFLFDSNFTAWLYGDRVGGNKFGVILRAKPEVSGEQLSAALALLESNQKELANLFVSSVGTPEQSGGFKQGPIDSITVRYLAFSTKNQNVFEYVPVRIQGKNYAVLATSYFQMSHILKLLGAEVLQGTLPTLTTAQ